MGKLTRFGIAGVLVGLCILVVNELRWGAGSVAFAPLDADLMMVPSYPIFLVASWVLRAAESLAKLTKPPQLTLMEMVTVAPAQSRALYVVTKLGVADILWSNGGPMDISQLARATSTHAKSLDRVMRCLYEIHIFDITEESKYTLNARSRYLVSAHPLSAVGGVLSASEEQFVALSDLLYSVRTGDTSFEHHFKENLWQFNSNHPDSGKLFNEYMTGLSAMPNLVVPTDYDFSPYSNVTDVAGGHGSLLRSILTENSNISGVLFDQENVLTSEIRDSLHRDFPERVQIINGDFFSANLPTTDVYVLKFIIHDWNDEQAIKILSNIKSSMPPNGRVILLEQLIVKDDPLNFIKTATDLIMLTSTGGMERTEDEYKLLFEKSGLELSRVIPTRSIFSVIEAKQTEQRSHGDLRGMSEL